MLYVIKKDGTREEFNSAEDRGCREQIRRAYSLYFF